MNFFGGTLFRLIGLFHFIFLQKRLLSLLSKIAAFIMPLAYYIKNMRLSQAFYIASGASIPRRESPVFIVFLTAKVRMSLAFFLPSFALAIL